MARTLVLGTAVGYDESHLARFLLSLRESGYQGDTALCVTFSEMSQTSANILMSWGASLEPFETWRYMAIDIQLSRYLKYFEFLSARKYDYIFLTDTFDVIFQKDPFDIDLSVPLYAFLEEEKISIGKCPSNSAWVQTGFGGQKLNDLFYKPISCSGTILGSQEGIMTYLTAMIQATGQLDAQALKMKGMDQGIHNVLIHDKILKNVELMENGKHINTMGHVPKNGVSLSPDGMVVNKDGSISNIIHQYNYSPHEELFEALRKRYSPHTLNS